MAFIDKQLSPSFKLSDLIVTNTGIVNNPTTAIVANLTKLAATLETLKSKIGNFYVESGYRSPAVQAKLRTMTAQAATDSLHEQGIAADIKPISIKPDDFFRTIANNDTLRNSLGEIAVKDTSLHISLPTPTKKSFFMKVIDDIYYPISLAEAKSFVWKFKFPLGSILILSGLGYLLYKYLYKGKK